MAHPDEELVRQVNVCENQLLKLLDEASTLMMKVRSAGHKLEDALSEAKAKYPKQVERCSALGLGEKIREAARNLDEASDALRKERKDPFVK